MILGKKKKKKNLVASKLLQENYNYHKDASTFLTQEKTVCSLYLESF